MLFDRDEDGVLSFQELQVVIKSMGQRPSGKYTKVVNMCSEVTLSSVYRRGVIGEGAGCL